MSAKQKELEMKVGDLTTKVKKIFEMLAEMKYDMENIQRKLNELTR